MATNSHPVFRKGATALITGAASGIGLCAAKFCSGHGMNLALVDNNQEALAKAAQTLQLDTTADNFTFEADVSDFGEWEKIQRAVLARYPGGVDFLMLNAGASVRPSAGKTPWQDPAYFQRTLEINTLGYTNGIAAFLDSLISNKGDARAIVLTGSKQGITNPPGNPAYNASKSAVKTIAEHLSFDLHVSNPNVSVHLLIPGWTYTGLMTGYFSSKPDGAWTPEQVVQYMDQKMAAGKFYILCPDNDVTEELDQKRITWGYGDIVHGRPPLTRWREDWKAKAAEAINAIQVPQQ